MKNIKSIELVFENCEGVIIPIECFEEFYIEDLDKLKNEDTIKSLRFKIKDNGDIEYTTSWSNNIISPLQRISRDNDITNIYIKYEDETEIQLFPNWYDNGYCGSQYNEIQTSELISYNELELIINPNVKTYSLKDVLEYFDNGVKIKDSKDSIYTIIKNENYTALDKQITLELMNENFRILEGEN